MSKSFLELRKDVLKLIEGGAPKSAINKHITNNGFTVEEFQSKNAKGWSDVIRGIYNKAKDGQRMTSPQRADFLRQSEELYATELSTHKQREDTYRQIAEANSLRPEVVVVNLITGNVTTNQTLTDLSEMSDDQIIKTLLDE